jgi:hypothetical protein
MNTMTQYTTFVGDINGVNTELKKASQDGRKPILMSSETQEIKQLQSTRTTYTIVFEQAVLKS